MKKILLAIIIFAIFISSEMFAQSREDIVYLNNGSIYRGKLIENVRGEYTRIEIVGHNIIVVPDSSVKKILMDQIIPLQERENKASPVEMAANVGFYGGSKNSAGFTFITAYQFPFRMSAGAGMGIEWFDHQQIPFMADIKYYFLKGSFSPYIYTQGGYAVPLTKKTESDLSNYYGGFLAGIGGGLRVNFAKHNALVFSLGYRYQKTKIVNGSYPWYSSFYQPYETVVYNEFNRLTFSFGFLFN